MIIYKLLKPGQESIYDDGCWKIGKWRRAAGLYGYSHPMSAALMSPLHTSTGLDHLELWEGECDGAIIKDCDHGMIRAERMRILKQLPMPKISSALRVTWAVRCALTMPQSSEFTRWIAASRDWLGQAGAEATSEIYAQRVRDAEAAAREAWALLSRFDSAGADKKNAHRAAASAAAAKAAEMFLILSRVNGEDEWDAMRIAVLCAEAGRAAGCPEAIYVIL